LISTRSIGLSRIRRNSKMDGPRWRNYSVRARSAGSAFSNFRRRTDEACAIHRSDHLIAAALLVGPSRGGEEILPYCEQEGIGVIVYSPMASGLLTGAMTRERIARLPEDDWRKNNPDFKRAEPVGQPRIGRAPARSRQAARPRPGRRCDRLDPRQSRRDRRHCRLAQARTGGRYGRKPPGFASHKRTSRGSNLWRNSPGGANEHCIDGSLSLAPPSGPRPSMGIPSRSGPARSAADRTPITHIAHTVIRNINPRFL